ncbi:hypothetical protein F383_30113 [Gossypium arboreum]|uniref:Uncharacterized protein n=1 Tax=Gossypium arboreum TaxID=29729 RepID=A0A0B0MTT2_GOSAR|nr:hypothetical protein F383_30113 [Gossypium arboreum]
MVMNNSRKFLGKKGFNQSPVEFVNALIEPQSMDLKLVAREASQSAEKLQIRILQPTMNFFPSLNGDEEARAVIVGSILENGLLKPSEEVIDATCYTGSDMENLVKDASMGLLGRDALRGQTIGFSVRIGMYEEWNNVEAYLSLERPIIGTR